MSKRIPVRLPDRSYTIHLGRHLLERAGALGAASGTGGVIVVSNETVAPLYLDRLLAALPGPAPLVHLLPDGERYKTLSQCERVLDRMLQARLGRDATVIALGGGVVGDLAGFAASIYQRGVRLVQIPTTLLAQVDSSVGGKTAVNHRRGKNMIGAFHQPDAVIADLATLDTLPERELRAGLAEVIKYALIGNRRFLGWLERNLDALLARDEQALTDAVATSCRHKARVVADDEREAGQRALLNLGHTFGHAIEAHLKYRDWLHGEAVATGMLMAADLSVRHGWLAAADRARVLRLIERAGLPVEPPAGLGATRMRRLMQGDKKAAAGRLRLVLLRKLGEAFVCADFDEKLLQQTLEAYCRP